MFLYVTNLLCPSLHFSFDIEIEIEAVEVGHGNLFLLNFFEQSQMSNNHIFYGN